jgi:hypothetical protein
MRSLNFLRLTLLCILPGFGTTAGANELTYADLVERLYDMKLLATPPVPGKKSGCFSSRDRASRYDEDEGKYIDWHANADGSGFVDREGTMMEMDGPGVIWRIWSARPEQGHLKIFVDGADTPVLDQPWINPAASAEVPKAGVNRQPVEWVNPLVDTHNSRWFYFNSACRPFGMVNLSPDTRTKGSWSSGYLYGDKHIRCFSHVHAWQLSGIPVLPITGPAGDERRGRFLHGLDRPEAAGAPRGVEREWAARVQYA